MKNQSTKFKLDLQLFADDPQPAPEPQPEPELPSLDSVLDVKKNYVPKAKYDRLQEEYKKAVSAVLNGDSESKPEVVDKQPTAKELTASLFGPGRKESSSNLETVSDLLNLRKQIMAEGGADPFVPHGVKIEEKNTVADYERAEHIASQLQECVDEADGDPIAFNNLLRKKGVR